MISTFKLPNRRWFNTVSIDLRWSLYLYISIYPSTSCQWCAHSSHSFIREHKNVVLARKELTTINIIWYWCGVITAHTMQYYETVISCFMLLSCCFTSHRISCRSMCCCLFKIPAVCFSVGDARGLQEKIIVNLPELSEILNKKISENVNIPL